MPPSLWMVEETHPQLQLLLHHHSCLLTQSTLYLSSPTAFPVLSSDTEYSQIKNCPGWCGEPYLIPSWSPPLCFYCLSLMATPVVVDFKSLLFRQVLFDLPSLHSSPMFLICLFSVGKTASEIPAQFAALPVKSPVRLSIAAAYHATGPMLRRLPGLSFLAVISRNASPLAIILEFKIFRILGMIQNQLVALRSSPPVLEQP